MSPSDDNKYMRRKSISKKLKKERKKEKADSPGNTRERTKKEAVTGTESDWP